MLKRRKQVTEKSEAINAPTGESNRRKPLRLWPGALAVAVQWFAMFVLPLFMPEIAGTAIVAGVAVALIVILWWLFFSRAPWLERVAAVVFMPLAALAVKQVLHLSIANAGRGYMFYIYSIPLMCLGLVVWATTTRNLSDTWRRASLPVAILLACGVLAIVRTNGVWGEAKLDFAWRWSATAEEKLLAQAMNEPPLLPPTPAATVIPATQPLVKTVAETPSTATTKKIVDEPKAQAGNEPMPPQAEAPLVEWSGFRGAERDGIVRGARINTDWSSSPPRELWRRPIGPAWSSFAVRGNRFFTQEQRGEEELVMCYNLNTGEPIWRHSDSTRFWESNGGAGPRATPTLHHDRVYTFGGTGIMNALNAEDGAVVWSRNVVADAKVKVPYWGCAASPLVVDSLVIIAAKGRLVAYDLATGNPRWFGPDSGWGYGSPQLVTIAGVAQIVLLNGAGAIGVAPSDGALLWEHKWSGDGILQPALTAEGDVIIGSGSGLAEAVGIRRIAISQSAGAWKVEERWTTNTLKPYYSDIVIHKGHAFGFDGSILACIDLADGKRKWKGGRYGHGQLFLLPQQDVMLVLTESGELALVAASLEQFTELARFPAIKGKTWNHPVLAGDILLVRNGEEMVAFRLSLAQSL